MAKVKISDFSSTPGNNTEIDNINISEGCAPSGINDAIRELMAQLKDFQTGAAGDSFNGPVGTTTAAAGAFTTLSASGAVTLSGGTANGVAYLNGSKVLTTGSALTFDGTNLGVGALNTNALLTLSGDKTAVRVERGSAIGFAYNTGTAATDSFRIQSNAGPVDIYTASGQPITFSAGATEQMRLTSTGLGIGTSSPGQKLDVTGNIGTTGTLINTATSGEITKSTGATTGNIYHRITNTGGSTLVGNESSAGGTLMVGSSAYSGLINVTGAYPLAFGTNNTERMRLDSSGNLGLGVTPSAWASWYRSLDMLGGGSFASSDAAFLSVMTHNAFYNGSNNIYKANGGASQYIQGSGSHLWFTAPSGTAGNAISFSQSMTLDASGRLGIGTTSPNSTLSVNGNILAPWANSGTYEIGVEQRTTNVFSTTTNVFVVRGADAVFGNDAMGGGSVLIRGGKGYGTAGGPAGDVVIQGGEALSGYVANPGNIIFKTGQTTAERARIDSSGNLLVGTTSDGFSGRVAAYGSGAYVAYSANNLTNTNFSIRLGGSAGNVALRALPGTGQGSISFEVGNAGDERARIDSSGNFSVGTTNTSGKTTIVQSENLPVLAINNTNASFSDGAIIVYNTRTTTDSSYNHFACYNGNFTGQFIIRDSGNAVNSNNSYGAISDAKLKENVVDATPKLEKLQQVRVVNYNLIGDEQKQIGVIAQELEQIFPGMVEESPDRDQEGNDLGTTTKSVKYSVFVPMLIKAMQEQQAIIESLKARLDAANL